MFKFDYITKEDIKENNSNQSQNPDYLYIIPTYPLIVGGSGSRKTNALLNLISHQPDIDNIYVDAKDL